MQNTSRFLIKAMVCMSMVAATGTAHAVTSRYAPLLASTAGQDTLRNLALWEDQRVTGEGALFGYLKEGSPLVQVRAAEVIGRLQDPADAPHLIECITGKNRPLAREAIFALGQLGNKDAIAPLIKARTGTVPEDLRLVAEALGKLGGEDAVMTLTDMLHDFSAPVRAEAALALAHTKSAEAANALLLSIHDPDPNVARNAIYALEKQDLLPRTSSSLVDFLENDDAGIRAAAAHTLGVLKCTEAAEALAHHLTDDDTGVVVNTCFAIGELKATHAMAALGHVLEANKSAHARAAAAMAFAKMGDKSARDALMQGMLDPSAMVRIQSLRAITAVSQSKAEMDIDQMRGDGNRLVRAEALESYGTAGLEKRAKELFKIAQEDKDPIMRVAAIHSLAKLKASSIPAQLMPLLMDPDFTVSGAAAEAMSTLKYRNAIPQLVDAYYAAGERNFVDVELATLQSLADLNATDADSVFVQAVSDPDIRVRTLASETLTKMNKTPPAMQTPRQIAETSFDRSRKKVLGPPLGIRHAVIKTEKGDVEIELYGDDAIQTVGHFIEWAQKGFYKNLTTHRVVPNFVVQGGDPRGDGNGDAGFTIPAEVCQRRYDREGYVGIADAGKDTGSCQWFITLSPQPRLSGRYTIIGKVTKGMENVWKLDQGDKFDVKMLD
ncbi:MAG TPA: HEAT repeat domain-containing protein [Candidatus Krumholzibacteria bacterium]|nr:HEAT repeat domain-containing protein [Candidatus Krumholzibacteria bacterium]